jgi:hypothetical protein
MNQPLIYHGNGGTTDGQYTEILETLLKTPAGQHTQPTNVLVLTWNNYGEIKDLDKSLTHLGYNAATSVTGMVDSEWVANNKFKSQDDPDRWVNLNKILYLKDFCDNYDFTGIDYVLVCDYTDVILTGDLNEVIKRFETFDCKALYNSEVNCFSSDEFRAPHDKIADETGKPRVYLNSGACITRANYLPHLVEEAFKALSEPRSTDDQILYHKVYLDNYPDVKIDREETIFKCMHNNEPKSKARYFDWYLQHQKVGIGLPMLFPFIHYKFVNSYLSLQKPPNNISISNVGSLTALARNQIVEIAQKQGCKYLMFLDTDMTFPPDTILKLMKHQKDVVSGLYFERYAPHRPVIRQDFDDGKEKGYALADYTKSDFMEVAATGGGCLLINMEVFDRLEKPYFDYRLEKAEKDHGVKETFFSEDLVFCEKVRAAGYKIWCDTTIRCGHLINDYEISEANWDGTTEFR